MTTPDDIATGENPAPLPASRFCDTMTVLGQISFYCIAPDPEDAARGLRVFRWLPWADDLRKLRRWREQGGERAHLVLVAWADGCSRRTEEAERTLAKALEMRDHYEERIGDIAAHVGCPDEWSNLHNHATCIEDAFDAVTTRAGRSEAKLAKITDALSFLPFSLSDIGLDLGDDDEVEP